MTGISFGESPRWHDGRLWFCDWGAEELIALRLDGTSEVIARVPSFPFSIDWRHDGLLLINAARQQAVLRLQPDGELVTYAELSGYGGTAEGVGEAGGFITGMNGGFEAVGSRLDGGIARSTTLISPAARARYSATSIGRCFFSTSAR